MVAIMSSVEKWFKADELEIERLLSDWRWLCPAQMSLLARNLFGELFLMDMTGTVLWLNTTVGKLSKVAESKAEFLEMAQTSQKRQEWFVEQEAVACRPWSRSKFIPVYWLRGPCGLRRRRHS